MQTDQPLSSLGLGIDRVDGRAKVTGKARYAADQPLKNVAHAVAVCGTIARGSVTRIDTAAAAAEPGVLFILTPQNAPRMTVIGRETSESKGQPGEAMSVLQDMEIHYGGQYVAVVIAETLTAAQRAASLVKISYDVRSHTVDPGKPIGDLVRPKKLGQKDPPDTSRGDVAAAFAKSAVQLTQTYLTPNEAHNPMEMHATQAVWDGDRLTLYDATQYVFGVKSLTATMLGLSAENVRVISPYLGGGFGCKGSVWPHVALTAAAARAVNRPVKLVLSREQMFTQVGYRPTTVQGVSLGASTDGKLQSIGHGTTSQTSDFDEWPEPCGKQTPMLYACDNVQTTHRMARVNAGTPCQMRAPGEATGTFALESAMDELAETLKIDPIELRLRNYAEKDGSTGKPFSSKALRECYKQGAEKFGWARRNPVPGANRTGTKLIGMGMATATYPYNFSPAKASVRLFPDGRAVVTSATHDIGTGTYTIMTQIAATALGLPIEKVKFELGDTVLPKAPVSGGSQTAASVGSAVQLAANAAVKKLVALAVGDAKSPLSGKEAGAVVLSNGRLHLSTEPATGESLTDLMNRNGGRPIEAEGESAKGSDDEKYSKHSWGAQFAEVSVDARLGEVRVTRFVGVFAGGRILNAKTAASQLLGGIVMGIGMALHEQVIYDEPVGRVINANLADYLVPMNADVPAVQVSFVDEYDPIINILGAKGLGELGITGAAAAVANAVYNATGKRIRQLPITLDKLL